MTGRGAQAEVEPEAERPAQSDDYSALDYVPPEGSRWGLGLAAIPVALFAVIPLVGLLLSAAVGALPWLADAPLSTVFYLLVLGALVILSRRRGLGTLAADFGLRFRWIDLAIGLGIAVAYLVLRIIVGVVLIGSSGAEPTGNVRLGDSFGQNLDLVLAAVILAPLVEELVFRGAVLRGVRHAILRMRRSPRPSEGRARTAIDVSVVASAALFAAMHLYEAVDLVSAVNLGIDTFLFGLLAGWIATRTGRLGPGIVAHLLSNGLAVLLLATVPGLAG